MLEVVESQHESVHCNATDVVNAKGASCFAVDVKVGKTGRRLFSRNQMFLLENQKRKKNKTLTSNGLKLGYCTVFLLARHPTRSHNARVNSLYNARESLIVGSVWRRIQTKIEIYACHERENGRVVFVRVSSCVVVL